MKRFTKVCLIAGAVCVLAGGGITSVAAAMGGRFSDVLYYRDNGLGREIASGIGRNITHDIREGIADLGSDLSDDLSQDLDGMDDLDEYAYRNGEKLSDEGNVNSFSKEHARKLEVEVRRGRVVILPDSDSGEIVVTGDSHIKGLTVYNDRDELKVSVGSKAWEADDFSDAAVYIHVPGDYRFEKVELKVKAQRGRITYKSGEGPVIAAGAIKTGKLDLDAAVGGIAVTGAETEALEVDSAVGAVKFEGNVTGSVDADCSVGAVTLDLAGKKADYNYEIKCKVGGITVDGESFSGISSERKIDNGAAKKMELDCKTGDVKVSFH